MNRTVLSCTFPEPAFKDDVKAGPDAGDAMSIIDPPRPTGDAGAGGVGGSSGNGHQPSSGAGGIVIEPPYPVVPGGGGPGGGEDDAGTADAPRDTACPGAGCSPITIAQAQGAVFSIAADDSAAFWLSQSVPTHWAKLWFARHGSTGQELITTLSDKSRSLALDHRTVFFGKDIGSMGGVFSNPRDSSDIPPEIIFQDNTKVVMIDAAAVYYQAANGVARINKGTKTRREIAPAGTKLLGVTDDEVIVLDGAKLKAAAKDATKPFSQARLLLDNAPDIDSLAFDSQNWYFAAPDEGKVYRFSRSAAPSSAPTPLASSEARPVTLRSDAQFLYWIADATLQLKAMRKAGGKPIDMGHAQPGALAVASGRVFWAMPEHVSSDKFRGGDVLMVETKF